MCHLLNQSQNVVGLHEPIEPSQVPLTCQSDIVDFIHHFFQQERESILSSGVASSKSVQGKVPDNHIGNLNPLTGKRVDILDGKKILVQKDLSDDFLLLIKQPSMFSAMLPILTNYFTCYATIRNPLAVLRSWNSVDMAVTDGHAPAAEMYDKRLENELSRETDVFQRQLLLLSWFFEQFFTYLEAEHIIRYENVVKTGGKALACIADHAKKLDFPLKTKNDNPLYNKGVKEQLKSLLLDSDGFYWEFYSKDDVSSL